MLADGKTFLVVSYREIVTSQLGFVSQRYRILLSQTRGYRKGSPRETEVKRTHCLFIDDLKVYQENRQQLKAVNEILLQVSNDTGACYGISTCVEIVFKHRKMIKGEGLTVLDKRVRALDPDENYFYTFLVVEQAGVKIKEVLVRVKVEMQSRLSTLLNAELYDKNLIRQLTLR